MRYHKSSAHLVCPHGYRVMSNQCVQDLQEKPVVMCPRGFKLFNGVCLNRLYSKPKPVCPRNFTFDRLVGQCYKVDVRYQFKDEAIPMPEEPEEELLSLDEDKPDEEDLLSLDEDKPEEPRPTAMPIPRVAPPIIERQTVVKLIQQRIPIPAPVVYLPRQAPPPPPPIPPPPPPQPYPVPVPYAVPHPVQVIRERPVPVPMMTPVHHKTLMGAVPIKSIKSKKSKHNNRSAHHKLH
eukprot:GHVS01030411.1.p1 GENE.GHVS01030411.1~~GHVS01030411.1.p1  ORF type:complete len:236 (+),score=33.74 GHVS01030411.1:174-881(+)